MELGDIRRRIKREKRTIDDNFWFTAFKLCLCVSYFPTGPMNNDDFHWEAQMMGSMNSPYAVTSSSESFILGLTSRGIELDILRERWNPTLTIPKVLQRIRQLMAEPNVNAPHPSSTEALQLYLDDHDKYLRIAEAWTAEHADVGAGEFEYITRYWNAVILENEILGCKDTGMRMNLRKIKTSTYQ
ncbi:hypothetical protein BUALT_Bualt10G0106000 [Buddleja alternifolia]|uniref:UBC core domain-containing protein n=1 Tax=Buddleja alternifolia TaxID=168488 RepID=A0AAV6X6B0_9LAMI|nr:hypothetical protein BUALT_Bualt10G0106000 [Buddleja alternifolia]